MTTREYNDCVRRYGDDLYRFALRYAGETMAAEDAVQDAFVLLWEQHREVNADKVKGWLIRILYRRLIDEHRHETVKMRNEKEEMRKEESWRQHEGFELHDALQQALNQLPEQQRILLLMRDLEGYDYAEMASQTGISVDQVGVYLFRARKTMKKLMEDYR